MSTPDTAPPIRVLLTYGGRTVRFGAPTRGNGWISYRAHLPWPVGGNPYSDAVNLSLQFAPGAPEHVVPLRLTAWDAPFEVTIDPPTAALGGGNQCRSVSMRQRGIGQSPRAALNQVLLGDHLMRVVGRCDRETTRILSKLSFRNAVELTSLEPRFVLNRRLMQLFSELNAGSTPEIAAAASREAGYRQEFITRVRDRKGYGS